MADLECPAEIWWGQIADRTGRARQERRQQKTERPPTSLQGESERSKDSASSREIPMSLNALVSTA